MALASSSRRTALPVSRWIAWRRLSRPERRATLTAMVLIPIVAASLRTLGLRATLGWVRRARPRRRASLADEGAIVSLALGALQRAERHGPYGGTCLSQSLALCWLLGRAGIETELRFGARRYEGRFEAHAWLERHGVPINETADVASRLTRFEVPSTPA